MLVVGAFCYVPAQEVIAQEQAPRLVVPVSHWSLGIKGGGSFFRVGGNPYNSGTSFFQRGRLDFTSVAGGTLEYTFTPMFGLGLEGTYNGYAHGNDLNGDGVQDNFLKGGTTDALMYASFNLFNMLAPNRTGFWSFVNFYANAGGGLALYHYRVGDLYSSVGNRSAAVGMGGLNLEFNVSKSLSFGFEGQYRYYNQKRMGYYENTHPKGYADAAVATIGLRYKFGAKDEVKKHVRNITKNEFVPLDEDKDGIIDLLDKCANTPAEVVVDSDGCPVDTDGDGVADYLDKCAGTVPAAYGKVDVNGCPLDTDGDGVVDYLDKCPGTPAEARGFTDLTGCPLDADGDGVADYMDKCVNTPAEAKGYVDKQGCPLDTDGDGIFDYLDDCPKLAGVASSKGCPEVKKEVKSLFQKALQGIQFQTGKADIKPTSYGLLNQIANILIMNPTYLIEVQGHTDAVGTSESNLMLSDSRALAVRNYLVSKGVNPNTITSKGYGEDKPVADNATKAGKAKNRRVEFVVTFEK